jgi:hypothetical protein
VGLISRLPSVIENGDKNLEESSDILDTHKFYVEYIMSEDSPASTNSSQSTLAGEAIKMPANFVEALATLVKAIQHENQLIAAVVIAIIAIIVPIASIVASVQDRTLAIILLVAVGVLVFLALAVFMSAFMLVKFRKRGKRSFLAEHQDDLRKQLLRSQNALIQLHNRIDPVNDSINQLIQEHQINGERADRLNHQLSDLVRYLESEEREINAWLLRLASVANMDLRTAAELRKARWDARAQAANMQQEPNSVKNRQP